MRSFSRASARSAPFWPLSRSGFSTPESTATPVVFWPPSGLGVKSANGHPRHNPVARSWLRDAEFPLYAFDVAFGHVFPFPGDLLACRPGSAGRPPRAEGGGPIMPGGGLRGMGRV